MSRRIFQMPDARFQIPDARSFAMGEDIEKVKYCEAYPPCLPQQIGRGTVLLWVNHINLYVSGDVFFLECSSGGMVVGCPVKTPLLKSNTKSR